MIRGLEASLTSSSSVFFSSGSVGGGSSNVSSIYKFIVISDNFLKHEKLGDGPGGDSLLLQQQSYYIVCVLGVGDGELHEAEDPGGKQQVHQTLALLHHHLPLDNF